MIHPVHFPQAVTVNAGTMTTCGQVIATSAGNFPQQMISGPGKSTFMINQSGYAAVNANQTMVFDQAEAAANEQSVFSSKAITTNQKEKTYTFQNQLTALQPNSFYVSTMPVHPSSQVFNGSNIRGISSQPQIITTQSSEPMLNQPQLLGLQTVNPLQPTLSWAPSNLQLYQNPIIFYNQQTGIRMAMTLPVAAAPQPPIPSISFAPPMKKKCKLMPKLKNLIGPSSGVSPSFLNSPMSTIQANVNQALPTPVAQQKFVTICRTDSNQVQIVNDETISTGIEGKPVSVETKISSPQKSQAEVTDSSEILHACLTPTSTVDVSVLYRVPSPLTVESSTMSVMTTSSVQVDTSVPSVDTITSRVPTVSSVNTITSSAPTVSSVDTITSSMPTNSSVDTITSSMPTVSSVHTISSSVPAVSSVDTITSSVPTVSSADTITYSMPSVSSADTITYSTPTVSSVDTISSSVPTVSSVPPDPCLTNRVSSNFNSKPSLPKAHNEVVFTSHQTNTTETVITTEHLKPQQSIQQLTSEPVKDKQKAIVKPLVLTHVINGFIIQESSEPFPVSQSALLDSPSRVLSPDKLNSPEERKDTLTGRRGRKRKKLRRRKLLRKWLRLEMENTNAVPAEENPSTHGNALTVSKKTGEINSEPENESTISHNIEEGNSAPEGDSTISYNTEEENPAPAFDSPHQTPMEVDRSSCEVGKSKSYENESTMSYKTGEENSAPENESTVSYKTGEVFSAPAFVNPHQTPVEVDRSNDEVAKSKSNFSQKLPSQWTVQDVFEFIQNFPGCSDYADNFKSQEVDGQALLLLNDDHLRTALCMKLGPALKLLSQIRSMQEKLNSQSVM